MSGCFWLWPRFFFLNKLKKKIAQWPTVVQVMSCHGGDAWVCSIRNSVTDSDSLSLLTGTVKCTNSRVGQIVAQTSNAHNIRERKSISCGIHLTFFTVKANICGAEHLLCSLCTHPPTCRASLSYFAYVVCHERKPLLQMVQLSALNWGFLSSLVVIMALTCFLCSLSHFSSTLCLFLSFDWPWEH